MRSKSADWMMSEKLTKLNVAFILSYADFKLKVLLDRFLIGTIIEYQGIL